MKTTNNTRRAAANLTALINCGKLSDRLYVSGWESALRAETARLDAIDRQAAKDAAKAAQAAAKLAAWNAANPPSGDFLADIAAAQRADWADPIN